MEIRIHFGSYLTFAAFLRTFAAFLLDDRGGDGFTFSSDFIMQGSPVEVVDLTETVGTLGGGLL